MGFGKWKVRGHLGMGSHGLWQVEGKGQASMEVRGDAVHKARCCKTNNNLLRQWRAPLPSY